MRGLNPVRLLPFVEQLRDYDPRHLRRDAVAGLTVAMVLMPQSMAYAQLADLPAYYGLYASLLPPAVAALFGSSRQLATGPAAVISLMTAASLEPLAVAGSAGFITYALLMTLLVGLVQLALGLSRLGLVVNFISHPVVGGFTNAAAIIIAASQLDKFLGVEVDKAPYYYQTVQRVLVAAWDGLHWPTLAMGVLAFLVMYWLRRLKPTFPAVLGAVVITTLLSWGLGFQNDRQVDLGALTDTGARGLVLAYNQALAEAGQFHHQRADLGQALMRLEDAGSLTDLGRLDWEHRIRRAALASRLAEERAVVLRGDLRRLRLWEAGGRFYPDAAATPEGLAVSGPWRVKVGREPLEVRRLTLMAGGRVVGAMPAGMPPLGLPDIPWRSLPSLAGYAVVIALLGFMEAISIAKAMAAKTGQRLDPNQELVGQGLANLAASLTHGFPVSGSFGRSAVSLQSGAVSCLASVITSVTVGVSLLFLTPLLYYLPQATLAAVIMMAVVGLINPHGLIHAWRARRSDGVIGAITFVATLVVAPELDRSIFLGAGLSLLVFLYHSMRPRVAVLSKAPDQSFKDASGHGLDQCRRVAVLRFDGPLFFANASYLEDTIAARRRVMPELKHVLLDCEDISDIDASGEEALALVMDRLRAAGIGFSLCAVHQQVMRTLERTHLAAKIGWDQIYPTVGEALAVIHPQAHRDLDGDTRCPLDQVCPLGGAHESGGR